LIHTNLAGAILWRADLQSASLDGADLTEANLTEADLQDSLFANVRLGTFAVRDALTRGIQPDEARQQLEANSKQEARNWVHGLKPSPRKELSAA
jgi:uncharacterized protein YjbI with pentapeptide repeats